MTDRERIAGLARQVHRTAVERNISTRQAAAQALVGVADQALLKAMAAEFLVDLIARSQRAFPSKVTPLVQRVTPPTGEEQDHDEPLARIPRKGTRARGKWERETPAGKSWAAAELEWQREANTAMVASIERALDDYVAKAKVEWTDELLASTFRTSDRVLVSWGEATVAQHEERRDDLYRRAGDYLKDAAVHQAAVMQLTDAGMQTLRELSLTSGAA